MIYDLTNPLHRKQFAKRANDMLRKSCTNAVLKDESKRSISQNSYLHVLCRILAIETGVTEDYSKQVYFKQLANPSIFIITDEDKITGSKIQRIRSSSELTKEEMTKAINTFRHWSEDNGYYLPEANPDDEGYMEFVSEEDKKAFHQAELESARLENYIQ